MHDGQLHQLVWHMKLHVSMRVKAPPAVIQVGSAHARRGAKFVQRSKRARNGRSAVGR